MLATLAAAAHSAALPDATTELASLVDLAARADLAAWNAALIGQWRSLALAFEAPGRPRFDLEVGPHLRHVLEHHEALLWPGVTGTVRYDERPRDARVEAEPGLAARRLARVEARLRDPRALPAAATPLRVELCVGLSGERIALIASTFGRELAFVGSHAVHHLALVVGHCRAHAIPLPEDAGRAPATVAHARGRPSLNQEMR